MCIEQHERLGLIFFVIPQHASFYSPNIKYQIQRGQERKKIPVCLWTSSDHGLIIYFVQSDVHIRPSLTNIKPFGFEQAPSQDREVIGVGGGGENSRKKRSWERSLRWYLTITCLFSLCISMLITKKNLSDLYAPCYFSFPFSLSFCPTHSSQERSSFLFQTTRVLDKRVSLLL